MSNLEPSTTNEPLPEDWRQDEEFRAIAALFVADLLPRTHSMRQAIAEDDLPTLTRITHQIKGVAATYGYPEIGQHAAAAERLCREPGSSVKRNSAIEELIASCEAAYEAHEQAGCA